MLGAISLLRAKVALDIGVTVVVEKTLPALEQLFRDYFRGSR
jgi:hypothetical protein